MNNVPIERLRFSEHRSTAKSVQESPDVLRRLDEHGFLEPVVVRPQSGEPGYYEVLTRPDIVTAAGKLGHKVVPVLIRDDIDEEDIADIVRAQYDAIEKNPIEEAEWLSQKLEEDALLNGGKPSIARLSRLLGRSRSQLSRSLALLDLPGQVQEHFRNGALSAAHGRFLCKLTDPAKQRFLADQAANQGLSVRDLQAKINEPAPAKTSSPNPQTKDSDTLALERELQSLIGCPVDIDHPSGVMTIKYFGNLEMLEGVLERLGYSTDS